MGSLASSAPLRSQVRAALALLGLVVASAAAPAFAGSPAQLRDALAFSRCMRVHGVPDWPDPSSGGSFPPGVKLLADGNPRFAAAQTACRSLLPSGGGAPSAALAAAQRAQALSFSRCMRAHGVPSFPDPDASGRIPDPASLGIDQGSPRFQDANQACQSDRPPYIPSNAAYDAWARAHGS